MNIDVTQSKIVNNVTGKIRLDTSMQESSGVEDEIEITQDFKVDVEVETKWDDNDNEHNLRPDSLTLIIKKSDGTEVDRHTINLEREEFSYVFRDLDKYDTNGEEIVYIADEEVSEGDNLEDNYIKSVGNIQTTGENSKKITITNRIANINQTNELKYTVNHIKVTGSDEELVQTNEYTEEVSEQDEQLITIQEGTLETITIDGYKLDDSRMPSEQEGEKVANNTVINFYYIQEEENTGTVIVKHIDEETGEVLLEEPIYGKVGETVETEAKNFEGYILVESPEETEVEIEEEEKVVTYYYEQEEKISEPVENPTDNTLANGVLPQTGEKVGIKSLLIVLSVIIIIAIITYKKNIEYRDIH